jgi:hypothetical protein
MERAMRVLVWSTGQDTGGQGYRIGMGFRQHAPDDWHVDVLNDSASVLGYPELQAPVRAGHRRLMARDMYRAADVVHLRNTMRGWQQQDEGSGKPILLHHHGTLYRDSHQRVSELARQVGALEVASTVDLCLLEPGVVWLPSPYEGSDLARLRADSRVELHDDGVLRVAHLPTNAKVKNSGAVLAALRQLQDEGHRLEIITNVDAKGVARHVSWRTALWQKAKADVYVDQLELGYGNNAVEAWGMGIPVVAGVADPAVRDDMLARWGTLPFAPATPESVYLVLRRLVESRAMREEYASVGGLHFSRWHEAGVVVHQLQGLYAAAPRTRPLELVPYSSPGWAARQRARTAGTGKVTVIASAFGSDKA